MYELPKGEGDLSEEVCHILHCAVADRPMPAAPSVPQEPSEFREDRSTIEFIYEVFPDAAASHALHDYVPKQREHLKLVNGKSGRKTTEELYESEGLVWIYEMHDYEYVCAHSAETFIIHGEKPRMWFLKAFPHQGIENKYGIYKNVKIGSKEVS